MANWYFFTLVVIFFGKNGTFLTQFSKILFFRTFTIVYFKHNDTALNLNNIRKREDLL